MGKSGTVGGVMRSNVSRETDDATAAAPLVTKEHRVIGNQGPWVVARSASRSDDWNGLQDGSIRMRRSAVPWSRMLGAMMVPGYGAAGGCSQSWAFQQCEYRRSPLYPAEVVRRHQLFASGASAFARAANRCRSRRHHTVVVPFRVMQIDRKSTRPLKCVPGWTKLPSKNPPQMDVTEQSLALRNRGAIIMSVA